MQNKYFSTLENLNKKKFQIEYFFYQPFKKIKRV